MSSEYRVNGDGGLQVESMRIFPRGRRAVGIDLKLCLFRGRLLKFLPVLSALHLRLRRGRWVNAFKRAVRVALTRAVTDATRPVTQPPSRFLPSLETHHQLQQLGRTPYVPSMYSFTELRMQYNTPSSHIAICAVTDTYQSTIYRQR